MRSKNKNILRLLCQLAFLAIAAIAFYLITIGARYSAHSFCPYAIVCFGLNKMGFIRIAQAFFAVAIIMGFAICISAIFWGRKFCGYVCPLGTLQEAIHRFDRKKKYSSNRLPFYMEKKLGRLKYIVLLITAILVLAGLAYLYMKYCPIMILSQISSIRWQGLAVVLPIFIGAFFISRVWCRFLCPYGALLNLFQSLGKLFKIKRIKILRNLEQCNDCGFCVGCCPMNLNILESEIVEDVNCIHCNQCADVCPRKAFGSCKDNG